MVTLILQVVTLLASLLTLVAQWVQRLDSLLVALPIGAVVLIHKTVRIVETRRRLYRAARSTACVLPVVVTMPSSLVGAS
jgi:hypothetical protein